MYTSGTRAWYPKPPHKLNFISRPLARLISHPTYVKNGNASLFREESKNELKCCGTVTDLLEFPNQQLN